MVEDVAIIIGKENLQRPVHTATRGKSPDPLSTTSVFLFGYHPNLDASVDRRGLLRVLGSIMPPTPFSQSPGPPPRAGFRPRLFFRPGENSLSGGSRAPLFKPVGEFQPKGGVLHGTPIWHCPICWATFWAESEGLDGIPNRLRKWVPGPPYAPSRPPLYGLL